MRTKAERKGLVRRDLSESGQTGMTEMFDVADRQALVHNCGKQPFVQPTACGALTHFRTLGFALRSRQAGRSFTCG